MADDCLCIRCSAERARLAPMGWIGDEILTGHPSVLRFACEICGNKRCPHHSDHRLDCTNSNERGQEGSIYE